jgi:replicative DNA helicase
MKKTNILTKEDLNKAFQNHITKDGAHLIKTNFENLDKFIGGFRKGELTCIGGRPGMGKTSFLTHLAIDIAKAYNVVFCSLSESPGSLFSYILAKESELNRFKLYENKLNQEEAELVRKAIKQIDSSSITFIHHEFKIERIIEEVKNSKVEVLFIDYLQLLDSVISFKTSNERIVKCLLVLKALAEEENISIIISSQLNNNVERWGGDKIPQIIDIQGSDYAEHIFDLIMNLYRPDYYGITEGADGDSTIDLTLVNVIKNKRGKRGFAALKYSKSRSSFSDWKEETYLDNLY